MKIEFNERKVIQYYKPHYPVKFVSDETNFEMFVYFENEWLSVFRFEKISDGVYSTDLNPEFYLDCVLSGYTLVKYGLADNVEQIKVAENQFICCTLVDVSDINVYKWGEYIGNGFQDQVYIFRIYECK